MRTLLIISTLLQCSVFYAQKISYYTGVNNAVFYDYGSPSNHFWSNYQSGLGYTFGVHLDSLNAYWWNIPVSIQFERYGASLQVGDGGLGATYSIDTRVDKSVLSLSILPLNLHFKDRLHFNLGVQLSLFLQEKIQGTYSYWVFMQGSRIGNAVDQYPRYSRSTYAGAEARVSYDLVRGKSFVLAPQYGYYFGFSNEFREFPEITKRMQHFLGIQMRRN